MIRTNDIRSLTDFQRRTKAHIARLRRTGRPEVLTVKGKAEIVVQDAVAYQKLLDQIEEVEAIAGIERGLKSMERGEGVPLRDWIRRMRRKHRIPRSR